MIDKKFKKNMQEWKNTLKEKRKIKFSIVILIFTLFAYVIMLFCSSIFLVDLMELRTNFKELMFYFSLLYIMLDKMYTLTEKLAQDIQNEFKKLKKINTKKS